MSLALAQYSDQRRATPVRRPQIHTHIGRQIPGYTLGAARADRLPLGLAIPLLGAASLGLWFGIFRLASALLG